MKQNSEKRDSQGEEIFFNCVLYRQGERVWIYFFLENIPAERLARMRRDFPSMPKGATVLIMIDSSLSGKGKEGVIVTTQFVYVGKWGTPRGFSPSRTCLL